MGLTCPSPSKSVVLNAWVVLDSLYKILVLLCQIFRGKFFHLMRYSDIDRFHSCRLLGSVNASGSNMIFPSLSSSDNIVWTGIFCNFWMSGHTFSSFFHSSLALFIQSRWIIEISKNNASTSSSFLKSALQLLILL